MSKPDLHSAQSDHIPLPSKPNQELLKSKIDNPSSSTPSRKVVKISEVVIKIQKDQSTVRSDETAVAKKSILDSFESHWLDFLTWFTPYRQLLLLIVAINSSIVLSVICGSLDGANRDFSLEITINIFVAIGIRNEWVIRFIYWAAIKVFGSSRVPIRIRKHIVGMLYHIG